MTFTLSEHVKLRDSLRRHTRDLLANNTNVVNAGLLVIETHFELLVVSDTLELVQLKKVNLVVFFCHHEHIVVVYHFECPVLQVE